MRSVRWLEVWNGHLAISHGRGSFIPQVQILSHVSLELVGGENTLRGGLIGYIG